jgi:inosine-uridine nucleoside N-ribohydrolase
MRHIILDTDVGIDDALALFLALSSPEIEVEAITTVNGNVPVEVSTPNVLEVARLRDNRVTKLIKHMIDYYLHSSAALDNAGGFPMHDPLCIGAVIQPELITWKPVYVDVELASNLTLGATVAQFETRE